MKFYEYVYRDSFVRIISDGPARKTFAQTDVLGKANLMRPEINRLGHICWVTPKF